MSFVRRLAHDVKWHAHRVFDAWQDRRLGIDASGIHEQDELELSGPNARQSYVYRGTPHLVLSLAFRRLGVDPRAFTFVDLGSGKGRVVVRAARHPFQGVEGVELSPKMHAVALENVDTARNCAALRSPVTLHNGDVVEYEFPHTPLVFFFFNGFRRGVLDAFLANLERSLRERPRPCYFIYVNPKNGDLLEAHALVRMPMSRLSHAVTRVLSPWPLAIYRLSSHRMTSAVLAPGYGIEIASKAPKSKRVPVTHA